MLLNMFKCPSLSKIEKNKEYIRVKAKLMETNGDVYGDKICL